MRVADKSEIGIVDGNNELMADSSQLSFVRRLLSYLFTITISHRLFIYFNILSLHN